MEPLSKKSSYRYIFASFAITLFLGTCFPHSAPVMMAGGILRGAFLAAGLALAASRGAQFAIGLIFFIAFYEPSMGRNAYTETVQQAAEGDYYTIGAVILAIGLFWGVIEAEWRKHPEPQSRKAQVTGYEDGPVHPGQI